MQSLCWIETTVRYKPHLDTILRVRLNEKFFSGERESVKLRRFEDLSG